MTTPGILKSTRTGPVAAAIRAPPPTVMSSNARAQWLPSKARAFCQIPRTTSPSIKGLIKALEHARARSTKTLTFTATAS